MYGLFSSFSPHLHLHPQLWVDADIARRCCTGKYPLPPTPGVKHTLEKTHQTCLRYGTIPNISANPVKKTPQSKTLYHPAFVLGSWLWQISLGYVVLEGLDGIEEHVAGGQRRQAFVVEFVDVATVVQETVDDVTVHVYLVEKLKQNGDKNRENKF